MNKEIILRPATIEDSIQCSHICFNAFQSVANQHNFPSEFPEIEDTGDGISSLIANEGFYSIVAEQDGKIIGSNFLDERGIIAGVGPISIAPEAQNSGVGRLLMQAVVERGLSSNKVGIRLNTASYHGRSQSLYTKMGFRIQAPMMVLQGPQVRAQLPHIFVRKAELPDLTATSALCKAIHGHERTQSVYEAINSGEALIVEREGRITGYSTGVSFLGHSVAETNSDIKALIAATPEYKGVGFLLPATNFELLSWCLEHGLRIVISMNYMTIGLYNSPQGAYLPSVLY